MRSTDAIPGKTYRLRRRAQTKLEMLDTPPEVRAAHRMRVKFLTGVKAGEISDIPSVSIVPLGESERTPHADLIRSRPEALTLSPVAGPVRQGTPVRLLDDKAGFDWKVVQVLPDGKIEVATTIFEQPSTRSVVRDRVQLLDRSPQVPRPSVLTDEAPDHDHFDESDWVAQNLSPDRPRRHIDVVAESIVLGPRCLDSCRTRFYRGSSPAECADRFRDEIRMKGVIQRDRKRGKSEGRIRVERRFELVLPDDFEAGDLTTVEDPSAILDLRPRSERPKRRNKSKTRRPDERPRRRRRRRPKSS